MAELERDKKLLDSTPYAISFELAKARVLEIRAQRDREIASWGVGRRSVGTAEHKQADVLAGIISESAACACSPGCMLMGGNDVLLGRWATC